MALLIGNMTNKPCVAPNSFLSFLVLALRAQATLHIELGGKLFGGAIFKLQRALDNFFDIFKRQILQPP